MQSRWRLLSPFFFIVVCLGILYLLFANAQAPNPQPVDRTASVTQPASTPTPTPSQTITENESRILGESADGVFYPVVRVVDGDTITVLFQEKRETVRLIGINTPETVDPRKGVECFGRQASAYAEALMTGVKVRLESDPTQTDRDRYGRMLRYVFLEDGRHVNLLMIEEGYAYEYTYGQPYEYQSAFKQAERIAQASGKGLWSSSTCSGQL